MRKQVQIQINLFASLKNYLSPDLASSYPVEINTPLSAVIEQIGIPREEVKIVFVNGIKKDLGVLLQGGERIGIFPPIGGG